MRKLILRLRKARSSALDDASSSPATSRGRASMIVTSAPKDFQTLANSQPMTPPPRTIAEAGTWSRRRACSEVMTRVPSTSRPGERTAVGAGGEHHVGAGVLGAVDGDGARAGQRAGALDDGDPAGLDQAGEALEEPLDDLVLVGVDAGHVDALEAGVDAELRGLAGRVGDLRGVEQGLRRDASHVEAGAPEVALLDQPDLQPQLGRTQRTGVAARACPEDEDVELSVRHRLSLHTISSVVPAPKTDRLAHLCTCSLGGVRGVPAECPPWACSTDSVDGDA